MGNEKVIVAAYAHPDDGEFLAGGTLAKWVEGGHQVYVICATNGNLGTKDRRIPKNELANIRKEELAEAMKVIGGNPPIFLGYDDGFVRENIDDLKEKLVYWFRKLKPDWIVTFDPWKTYEIHPDHIEVGRMASEAAVFACFPLLYPEHMEFGLEPHQPKELWYMTPMEHKPNRLVDISLTFEKKIKAILCHQSQVEMLADMFVTGADPTNLTDEQKTQLREGTKTLMQMASQALGALSEGKVELAEVFYAIKVGAGHFDNYQEMLQEMIGLDTDPLIIM
ncbi:MAG: PIG-L deacetylase family protein [Candidatus Hodarchaeales archaeon]|jgi:LmbE family N-acetylglucosaminyl deacetylase